MTVTGFGKVLRRWNKGDVAWSSLPVSLSLPPTPHLSVSVSVSVSLALSYRHGLLGNSPDCW